MNRSLLVTGAAGFIGSAFVREAIRAGYFVVAYDALTYAGKLKNIEDCVASGSCEFIKGNICDYELLNSVFLKREIGGIVNFAAETHVDNSIFGPKAFVETNIVGTFNLLEISRAHWSSGRNKTFRFLHVSTDEVFGELGDLGSFNEQSPYRPNSPYSATKASSDHLVRAWHRTYGLPTLISNCSNNYGPRQLPEKLIPKIISNAVAGEPIPIYGDGKNIRDWIHVEDHVRGILLAYENGMVGDSYCFGGKSERSNIYVATQICGLLDELRPRSNGTPHSDLIRFVKDRLGHDWRYAIDDTKSENELGFTRRYHDFESGLRQTVNWYLDQELNRQGEAVPV